MWVACHLDPHIVYNSYRPRLSKSWPAHLQYGIMERCQNIIVINSSNSSRTSSSGSSSIIIYITFMQVNHNYIHKTWSVFTICTKCNVILSVKYDLYIHNNIFHRMCAVPNMAVFVAPQFHACLVCCSGIFWMILKWFKST